MTTAALETERGAPHDDGRLDDLPRAFKDNNCRCTGYRAIEDAVRGVQHAERPCTGRAVPSGRWATAVACGSSSSGLRGQPAYEEALVIVRATP